MPSLCAVFLVSTGFVAVITIKSDTPSHPIRTWTTRIELDFLGRKLNESKKKLAGERGYFNITCYFNPKKPRQCEISGNRSQDQVCAQCCRRFTPRGSPLWLSAPYARAVWKPTGHGQSPRSELGPKTGLSKRCAARGGLYNRTRGATSAYIRSR